MNAQASRLEIRVPMDQNKARELRRAPEAKGRNSRKMAASTGRLPPTPKPRQAKRAHTLYVVRKRLNHQGILTYAIQLGAPPAASPKTPQRNRVMLKAGRRPIASEARPQNEAPTISPTKREHVVNRT